MEIEHIKLSDYRTFGDPISIDFGKITVLIGKNNSGKSSILDLLYALATFQFRDLKANQAYIQPTDIHSYAEDAQIEFELGIKLSPENYPQRSMVTSLLQQDQYREKYRLSRAGESMELLESPVDYLDETQLNSFATSLLGGFDSDASVTRRQVRDWLRLNESISLRPVNYIKSDRNDVFEQTRRQIYQLLNSQDPIQTKPNKFKISKIEQFLISLLEEEDVTITARSESDIRIAFNTDEDVEIPLGKLSSGTQQLLMIGLNILNLPGPHLVLIDEPELHLHPSLQRKLLNFLNELDENHRIVLATHSSVLLDSSVDKRVVAFEKSVAEGQVETLISSTAQLRHRAIKDIGFRSSDILLANGVIWVEGPSDMIYLRKWLELKDPSLQEGLHYTFQYYGGTLLGHLSTEYPDTEVSDQKLSILTLNPNFFFLMDSDQTKPYKTKDLVKRQRSMISALNKIAPNLFWITDGYTIENYLPDSILNVGQFQNPKSKIKMSKVDFAQKHVDEITGLNFDRYGLSKRMDNLIKTINSWNVD